jgi:hypothetical protein
MESSLPAALGASSAVADASTLRRVRALLLALVTIGMVGTAVDLLLLDHYEEVWQFPPIVMIVLGLGVVAWVWYSGSANAMTAMRISMVLFLATGAAGMLFHYNGNREFQREMDPSLGGWALFVKVMRAKAPPALAPAAMIQIGLLGLLYTYRLVAPANDPAGA